MIKKNPSLSKLDIVINRLQYRRDTCFMFIMSDDVKRENGKPEDCQDSRYMYHGLTKIISPFNPNLSKGGGSDRHPPSTGNPNISKTANAITKSFGDFIEKSFAVILHIDLFLKLGVKNMYSATSI